MTREQVELEICDAVRTIKKNAGDIDYLLREKKHDELFWRAEAAGEAIKTLQYRLNDLKFHHHEK